MAGNKRVRQPLRPQLQGRLWRRSLLHARRPPLPRQARHLLKLQGARRKATGRVKLADFTYEPLERDRRYAIVPFVGAGVLDTRDGLPALGRR